MNGTSVPQEKADYILEAVRLLASSSGLQPYEILVITDPEVKERIKPIAWNQSQITDASHVLVFAAWDNYTEERSTVYSKTTMSREAYLTQSLTSIETSFCKAILPKRLKKILPTPPSKHT